MGGYHLYNSSGSNKPGVPHPCGFCKGGAFRSSSDAKGLRRCYGQKHLHFAERASQGTPDQIPTKFVLDNRC